MKPLHIVILLAAGAIGGAVIMKVAQRPPSAAPALAVAQLPDPPAARALHGFRGNGGCARRGCPPGPPLSVAAAEGGTRGPKPGPARHAAVPQPAVGEAPHSQPGVVFSPIPVEPLPAVPEPAPIPPPPPPAPIEPENVTPPPAPPEPHRVTLNAGTIIPVRLVDGLTAERNLPGDSFTATLTKEVVADGFVIAERGARVEGRVVASDKGGRVKGVSTLAVELLRLHTSDGQTVAIQTDGFERRAEEAHRQDAERVGAGAALGAVIGAIAGGGKGAAIGAGVGGGAGAGTVLATRGVAATLPSETRPHLSLEGPRQDHGKSCAINRHRGVLRLRTRSSTSSSFSPSRLSLRASP